jgi:transcriptional regulator with XRE-family HTH domain
MGYVDARTEFRDFLTSRRSKLGPEQAGLPVYGGNRRVPGLRREEVALLAGMSVDYYVRLERGNARGVSEAVLESLARALQLDEAERAHLFDLAHAVNASSAATARATATATRRAGKPQVKPGLQRIIDAMETTPAYVRNRRLDILAINRLGRALMAPVYADPTVPANTARFLFLDPAAREFYCDWPSIAADIVAALRSEVGASPHDKALQDLIGELCTRSDVFRTRWAAHNVRYHHSGRKRFRHPVVGELDLDFDTMELPADPGLAITVYSAEPGSPAHDSLNLLAAWGATLERESEDAEAGH